jgi:hypothetical protein
MPFIYRRIAKGNPPALDRPGERRTDTTALVSATIRGWDPVLWLIDAERLVASCPSRNDIEGDGDQPEGRPA